MLDDVRRHASIVSGLAVLFACTAPAPEPERGPPTIYRAAPVAELPPASTPAPVAPTPNVPAKLAVPECAPVERPLGSREYVRHQDIDLPERFDPSGKYAASGEQSCDVWQLDGEVFLGTFGGPRASGECVKWPEGEHPCTSWPELEQLALKPAEPLHTTIKADGIELVVVGHIARALFEGQEGYRFSCSPESAYVAVSLSPDGTRLAIVRPDAIELREFVTGKLLAEFSLDRPAPTGGKLMRVGIGWSRKLPVALLGRCAPDEDECDSEDEPIWELRKWAAIGAPVEATSMVWDEKDRIPAWIDEAAIDPLGRWLFVHFHWGYVHDSETELRQIPLTPEAAELNVDMGGVWFDDVTNERVLDPWGIDSRWSVAPGWISGSRTARWWKITHSNYDGEGGGSDTLAWAGFQLWPTQRHTGPHELASDSGVLEQSLEVFGVGEDGGVLAWSHCWSPQERESLREQEIEDVGEDGCRGRSPIPPGCEARGISDELDWLLVACDPVDAAGKPTRWRLLPLGAAAEVLEPVELAGAEDGPVTAVFGRSGLALAGTRGTRMLSPNGQPRALAVAFVELLPAKLGPELDRVVARGSVGLGVLDIATGKRLTTIPASIADDVITQLAFSPDGRRIAWSDSRHIKVWDVEVGNLDASWDAGSVLGLAWRQDGLVLLSGSERALPEHAWNPDTGKLADDEQPDKAFVDRLADADLDPSWRWAFEGDDVILRVVDGLALYIEDEDCLVTENGWHDDTGSCPLWVRIVGEPGVTALGNALRHHNLLEAFLAGESLPTMIYEGPVIVD
jgi:hypothetical protein